jgi:3-hydroxybutyryl-CoA dehydrogenase
MMGNKIAIVGSGTMGSGIAQAALSSNYNVVVIAHSEQGKIDGSKRINVVFEKAVAAKAITAQEKEACIKNLQISTDYAAISDAELVIEAVSEIKEVKESVLKQIEAHIGNSAVIATNTSSIPISALSGALSAPSRFIGMHFFNPVPVMKVAEVINGASTSTETINKAKEFIESLGKIPVQVKDSPGFIANRLLMLFINEAATALDEGVSSKEGIDAIVKLGLHHPMGPFELADFIGIDVCNDIMLEIYKDKNDMRFKPSNSITTLVKEGKLGRKSMEGFYKY